MGASRGAGIIDMGIPGMGKSIQKAETYNKYGVSVRRIEIATLEVHVAFVWIRKNVTPEGEVVIGGMIVYTIKRTSLESGYTKQMHILIRTEDCILDYAGKDAKSSRALMTRIRRRNYRV